MNNLTEIKRVPFMGCELMAAKADDGTIYAGVSYICNGMGMSEGQVKAERVRIRNDSVLSKGGTKFRPPFRWRFTGNALPRIGLPSPMACKDQYYANDEG